MIDQIVAEGLLYFNENEEGWILRSTLPRFLYLPKINLLHNDHMEYFVTRF